MRAIYFNVKWQGSYLTGRVTSIAVLTPRAHITFQNRQELHTLKHFFTLVETYKKATIVVFDREELNFLLLRSLKYHFRMDYLLRNILVIKDVLSFANKSPTYSVNDFARHLAKQIPEPNRYIKKQAQQPWKYPSNQAQIKNYLLKPVQELKEVTTALHQSRWLKHHHQ